ncbi:MAG: response regulator, partial [Clostridiales bacterium]|nr:response regulator [Clostridiales bacterium]
MIRVMIVEDEPASARFLTQLLETRCRGVQVAALAEDGQAAIKTLKNTMVDIVITDIQMSPMDGLRLAGWIKENMPDIDTLIVSGHNDFEYAKGAISSGVAEYLLKPIRPSEFSSVMEKLIVKVRQRKREKCEEWLIRGLNPGSNEQSPFPCQCGATLGAVRLGGVSGGTRMPARKFEYPSDCPESLAAVYAREGYEVCFALPVQDSVDIEGLVSVIARDAAYFTAFYNTIPYGGSSGCLPDMLDK